MKTVKLNSRELDDLMDLVTGRCMTIVEVIDEENAKEFPNRGKINYLKIELEHYRNLQSKLK